MGESEIIVLEHKKLNINKIKSNDKLLEYLVLDCEEQDVMQNEIDMSNDYNYKEILVEIVKNNHKYLLLHGFAGDLGKGCVLLDNGDFVEVGDNYNYCGRNNDLNIINEWYCEITRYHCEYVDEFWY